MTKSPASRASSLAVSRQLEPASVAVPFGLFLLGLVLVGVAQRSGPLFLAKGERRRRRPA